MWLGKAGDRNGHEIPLNFSIDIGRYQVMKAQVTHIVKTSFLKLS